MTMCQKQRFYVFSTIALLSVRGGSANLASAQPVASQAHSRHATTCLVCDAGEAPDSSGSLCVKCPAGRYSVAGASTCEDCSVGFFASSSGSSSCTRCDGDTFAFAGGQSCGLCRRFLFLSENDKCELCPEGSLCASGLPDGGATVSTLRLKSGYWRFSFDSGLLYPCPLAGACIGGAAHAANNLDSYCAEGYVGPLCSVCDSGYFYSPVKRQCDRCEGTARNATAGPLIFLVVSLVAASVFSWCLNREETFRDTWERFHNEEGGVREDLMATIVTIMEQVNKSDVPSEIEQEHLSLTAEHVFAGLPSKRTEKKTSSRAGVSITTTSTTETKIEVTVMSSSTAEAIKELVHLARHSFKAFAATCQICANVGVVCGVAFSSQFERFMTFVAILNLDVVPTLSLQCPFEGFDHVDKLFITTLFPLALVACLGVAYGVVLVNTHLKEGALNKQLQGSLYATPQEMSGVFSPDEGDSLRKLFAEFDPHVSGVLDRDGLISVMQRLDPGAEAMQISLNVHEMLGDDELQVNYARYLGFVVQARLYGHARGFNVLVKRLQIRQGKKAGQHLFSLFLVVSFAALVGASTAILQVFNCEKFGNGAGSFLKADFSVACEGSRYTFATVYAGFMILVYPIGTPLLYAFLLFEDRKFLRNPVILAEESAAGNPNIGHLFFLFAAYSPRYYFWEVVECLRRVLLGSVLGLLSSSTSSFSSASNSPSSWGNSAAPAAGVLLSLAHLFALRELQPYACLDDNRVASVLSACVLFFFFAALLVKGEEKVNLWVLSSGLTAVFIAGPALLCFQLTPHFCACSSLLNNGGGSAKEEGAGKNNSAPNPRNLSDHDDDDDDSGGDEDDRSDKSIELTNRSLNSWDLDRRLSSDHSDSDDNDSNDGNGTARFLKSVTLQGLTPQRAFSISSSIGSSIGSTSLVATATGAQQCASTNPCRDLLLARFPRSSPLQSSSMQQQQQQQQPRQPQLVLEVEGASRRRGGAVILWSLSGSDHQRWEHHEPSNQLAPKHLPILALNVAGGATALEGSNVILWNRRRGSDKAGEVEPEATLQWHFTKEGFLASHSCRTLVLGIGPLGVAKGGQLAMVNDTDHRAIRWKWVDDTGKGDPEDRSDLDSGDEDQEVAVGGPGAWKNLTNDRDEDSLRSSSDEDSDSSLPSSKQNVSKVEALSVASSGQHFEGSDEDQDQSGSLSDNDTGSKSSNGSETKESGNDGRLTNKKKGSTSGGVDDKAGQNCDCERSSSGSEVKSEKIKKNRQPLLPEKKRTFGASSPTAEKLDQSALAPKRPSHPRCSSPPKGGGGGGVDASRVSRYDETEESDCAASGRSFHTQQGPSLYPRRKNKSGPALRSSSSQEV